MVNVIPKRYEVVARTEGEITPVEDLLSSICRSNWRNSVFIWKMDAGNDSLDPRIILDLEYEKPKEGFYKRSEVIDGTKCNIWERDSLYAVGLDLGETLSGVTNLNPSGMLVVSEPREIISTSDFLDYITNSETTRV